MNIFFYLFVKIYKIFTANLVHLVPTRNKNLLLKHPKINKKKSAQIAG